MTVLSGETLNAVRPVQPFRSRNVVAGLSCGLSCAGYDVRIAQDIWLHKLMPMRLASTVEKFEMPDDVLAVVHDKSTWARRGVHVQNTVIEPGWRGWLTLELSANVWKPVFIAAGTPIAQVVFHRLDRPTWSYDGKYQDQPARPVPALREPSGPAKR